MARGWIHTIFRSGLWVNEVEQGGPMTKHEIREEAVESAREAARRLATVHVLHSAAGEVRETRDYGVR